MVNVENMPALNMRFISGQILELQVCGLLAYQQYYILTAQLSALQLKKKTSKKVTLVELISSIFPVLTIF